MTTDVEDPLRLDRQVCFAAVANCSSTDSIPNWPMSPNGSVRRRNASSTNCGTGAADRRAVAECVPAEPIPRRDPDGRSGSSRPRSVIGGVL